MKAVYIAHPLGAGSDREANRARAARWVAWAGERSICPMASWIILSGEWAETPGNRERGLAIDFAQIERCDEVWLCGPFVSKGMALEADYARQNGIPVIEKLTLDGKPPA